VLLLDEADGLVGPAMVSFLTQLRHGCIGRSRTPFPSSVVLVGQRQVRGYVFGADDRRIRRDTETEAKALDQVARYLDRAGLGDGWLLMMFDLRKEVAWADKLFVREVAHEGKKIRIVGC
jgi:hypothetical protein